MDFWCLMTFYKKTFLLFFLFFVFSCLGASEVYAMTVKKINVIGNKRIPAKDIIETSSILVNEDFEDENIDDAIKLLMATGNFEKVSIKNKNSVVTIIVKEYQRINQIIIQGNKKVKTEDLLKVVNLQSRDAFDITKLKSSVALIKEAYESIGLMNTHVTASLANVKENRADVIFTIVEGKPAKVKYIQIIGAKNFPVSKIKSLLITKETNILSWLTQGNVYSEDRLNADEEIMKQFYQSKGYADFRVLSRRVSFNSKTNDYTIIYTIDEGIRYKIGSVLIENQIKELNVSDNLKKISTKPGDWYNIEKISQSIEALNEIAANNGFAFATIDVHSDRNFSKKTLSLVYNINKGTRIYVEKIEIRGNTKTKDKIIRRAFDIVEGDAFNQILLQKAKRRLDNSGFFQSVSLSTKAGSAPDKIILVVEVSEQNTGTISASAGYATGEISPGFTFEGSMREANLLGRGQSIDFSASVGASEAKTFNLSFKDPYFLGYRISSGIDLFRASYLMNDSYNASQTGVTGSLGFALTDNLALTLAYNYVIEKFALSSSDYPPAIIEAGQKPRFRSSVQYGLNYNTLDNMIVPHDGNFMRISQEASGLGGDARFLKTTGKFFYYKTLVETLDLVGSVSFNGGIVGDLGGNSLQVFDMFKNTNDTIRGFRYNGIGPTQANKNGDPYFLGGKKMMNAAIETTFPFPIIPSSLGLRGAFFVNAGTIYDSFYKPKKDEALIEGDSQNWRVSAGASLLWLSPLGPLRFDYALPLKKYPNDIVQNFVFGISTQF